MEMFLNIVPVLGCSPAVRGPAGSKGKQAKRRNRQDEGDCSCNRRRRPGLLDGRV